MLHLDGSAHALDTLNVAPCLTGAEQDGGDGANNGKKADDPQHIGGEDPADDGDHRSPRRRSSMRAQTIQKIPASAATPTTQGAYCSALWSSGIAGST